MPDIPLPALPRAISAATGGPTASHRTCYTAAVDGRIPAFQRNGRWFVDDADLPAVVQALGLALLPAAKKRRAQPPPPPTAPAKPRRLRNNEARA